jgi:hypothetical protein
MVVQDLLLAKLTAPSSILPICPTVKILATGSEYCSINVKINGAEDLVNTFASLGHVVVIFPAATASFHVFLIVLGSSSPPYGRSGFPPRRGVRSKGISEPIADSSSAALLTFRNADILNRFARLPELAPSLPRRGCLGGKRWLSRSKLRSSSRICARSFLLR